MKGLACTDSVALFARNPRSVALSFDGISTWSAEVSVAASGHLKSGDGAPGKYLPHVAQERLVSRLMRGSSIWQTKARHMNHFGCMWELSVQNNISVEGLPTFFGKGVKKD